MWHIFVYSTFAFVFLFIFIYLTMALYFLIQSLKSLSEEGYLEENHDHEIP